MVSGAGRKVFQPGEVLTASNVQNYLQDQAVQYYAGTAARGSAIGTATTEGMISYLADTNSVQMATGTATWVNVDSLPIVAGTAERAALYPSPVQGNTVWRSDVKYMETYHTASGTAAAGWYSGQNGGLVPLIPSSITVGSGSASVSGNGLISFTGTSSISLNGIFSSTFSAYRMIIKLPTTSVANYMSYRFRVSGTDNSSSNYYQYWFVSRLTGAYNTNTGRPLTSATLLSTSTMTSNDYTMGVYDIINPYQSAKKIIFGTAQSADGTSSYQVTMSNLFNNNAVNADGITLFANTGTHTGNVIIYGYRE